MAGPEGKLSYSRDYLVTNYLISDSDCSIFLGKNRKREISRSRPNLRAERSEARQTVETSRYRAFDSQQRKIVFISSEMIGSSCFFFCCETVDRRHFLLSDLESNFFSGASPEMFTFEVSWRTAKCSTSGAENKVKMETFKTLGMK